MKFIATLALAGLAQAARQFTSNGVHYSVAMTQDGVEVPADFTSLPGDLEQTHPGLPQDSSTSSARRLRRRNSPSSSLPEPFVGMDPEVAESRRDRLSKRVNVAATTNWCGLADGAPPSGTKWKSVHGGWTVPKVSLRSGQKNSDAPSIAQWVGIDGAGCNTGLIQGGTVSQINKQGKQENYAWWEFVPDALHSITMSINTGDVIYGNVTMTSPTSGIVEIINRTQGKGLSVVVTNGPGKLCGATAEWVLEDLSCCGGLAPFAAFPSNNFHETFATSVNGNRVTPSNANQINLHQNDKQLCKALFNTETSKIEIVSTA